MKKILIPLFVLLLLLLAALAGSGFLISALLTGSGKDALIAALSARAGVPIEVDSAEFDVRTWYQLNPALRLEGVRVGNPAGFAGQWLLTTRGMSARVALKPLWNNQIQVESLHLTEPVLAFEKNRQGISNLEAFSQTVTSGQSQQTPPAASAGATLSVAEFIVDGAAIHLRDTTIDSVDLRLEDFAPGQPCRAKIRAGIGVGSDLVFEGRLGPFGSEALPLEGNLRLNLALSSIPEPTRRREFGELLADPGRAARIAVQSDLKGDLYGSLAGPARLTLRDVMAGRDGVEKLRLDGEVPMQASISKALSTPLYDLRIRNGALRMGEGEWKGNLDVLLVGGVVRGKSSGAIRNVDLDRFLTAFTRAAGRVQGVFALENYTLRFGGKDAAAIRESLAGSGTASVEKGRLKELDMLAAIRAALEGAKAPGGDTEFSRLDAKLEIGGQRMRFPELTMSGPAIQATGSGSITFAQALDFRLSTIVRGRAAELLGRKASENAPAEAAVPMRIGGTVAKPAVYPDIGKLARQTGAEYAERVIREKVLTEGVKEKVREKLKGFEIPLPFGGRKKE
ncbi:MAG: AsmA-like C-terminal region-containing protein [Bryobacteraceae bacterium]